MFLPPTAPKGLLEAAQHGQATRSVSEFARRRWSRAPSLAYERFARPPPRQDHSRRLHEVVVKGIVSMADWGADLDDEMEGAPLAPPCAYRLRGDHTQRRAPSRARRTHVGHHGALARGRRRGRGQLAYASAHASHVAPCATDIELGEDEPLAEDEAVGEDGYEAEAPAATLTRCAASPSVLHRFRVHPANSSMLPDASPKAVSGPAR